MLRFILLSFAVLAVWFWVASGGSNFEPQQITRAAPKPQPEPAAQPEPVVQPTPTVEPAPSVDPAPAPPQTAPQPDPVAEAIADVLADPTPEPAPEPAPAPQPARIADIRYVDATRVNMRSGPSTDFRVVDTLSRGTQVQVLERDAGWVLLRVSSTQLEGWMAEQFLAAE